MTIDSKGILQKTPYKASPHCDERPKGMAIDLVVLHGISLPPGEFGQNQVEPFFMGTLNPEAHPYFKSIATLRTSAHLFITRKGEVTQFVPFLKRAWHAGVSSFLGRERCNDFSIGIELEGCDELPYEPAQYQQLAVILPLLMQTYTDITPERIVGHSTIAPGRKTDPGTAFDWVYLKTLICS